MKVSIVNVGVRFFAALFACVFLWLSYHAYIFQQDVRGALERLICAVVIAHFIFPNLNPRFTPFFVIGMFIALAAVWLFYGFLNL